MPFVLWTVGVSLLQWLLPRLLAVFGAVAFSEAAVSPVFEWLEGQISTRLSGLGADAFNFLSFLGVVDAISIIFAGYAMAISIKVGKAAFAKSGATRV